MAIRSRIAGTGGYVPPHVVTNDDLAKLMDTNDEWIQKRTGIKERRHVRGGMEPSELAVNAAEKAMEMAGCTAADLDCIIVPTLSSEHYFPGTAAFVARRLGHDSIPAFDLRAQCSGFVYGLNMADAFIRSGMYKKILLVGVEVHSNDLDYTDRGRDVAVLFGDGAGAVILEPTDKDEGILSCHVHLDGQHAERLWVEVPALGKTPCIVPEDLIAGKQHPQMDGRFVFKHACTRLPQAVMEAMSTAEIGGNDVDMFFFHQANLRINELVGRMMEIPAEKAPYNIDKYGNCSAASIPLLFDECVRDGRFKRGDVGVMAAFGSGFTWGSAAIRF